MLLNYQKICQRSLEGLAPRTRDILSRRFGLQERTSETLEAIGREYGITRERVRQIVRDGLEQIKPRIKAETRALQYLESLLRRWGGLKREETFFQLAARPELRNELLLVLTCGQQFERQSEDKELHSLWTIDTNSLIFARELINFFVEAFEKRRSLLSSENLFSIYKKNKAGNKTLSPEALLSFVELSKKIAQGPQGLFGLRNWPEISPRGVKDKAYLVLVGQNRPLHFTEITSLINESSGEQGRTARQRTVHNELIKDNRFVLVGRGLYGLREWGYQSGLVKDIIFRVLKEAPRPLTKKEIINKVLKQRIVSPNTVLLNLNNGKQFLKDEEGRYRIP